MDGRVPGFGLLWLVVAVGVPPAARAAGTPTERAEVALADRVPTLTELSEIYELCAEEGHATTQ